MTQKTDSVSSETVAGEQALVQASQSGDADAFARLYDAYLARVYRYVYFRVSDKQVAEDIASDVFLRAWENLKRYRIGSSPFIAWLYRIAHNAVIDYHRKKKPETLLQAVAVENMAAADKMEDRLELKLESEQLRRSLHHLTDEQQQVIILKFIGGLSTQEIARQMGKRQGAVRALQMRALQTLANVLGQMELEV